MQLDPTLPVLTPDEVMTGERPAGEHVVIFDDDHYYMGGVLAELLAGEGRRVTLVTPSARVSEWSDHTMEQERIQGRLMTLGVELQTSKGLEQAHAGGVRLACAYTGRESEIDCDALVLVTARLPNDGLARELAEMPDAGSVRAVGDAYSPGTIAAAVWDGRRYAEELDGEPSDPDSAPFLREVVELAPSSDLTAGATTLP
jgi:dimethylamine/trimethylamine dehydrogenase